MDYILMDRVGQDTELIYMILENDSYEQNMRVKGMTSVSRKWGGVVILNKVLREDLAEKVTCLGQ